MKEISLTQGQVALVDDADYEKVKKFKWHAMWNHGHWYAARKVGTPRTTQLMHRFILNLETDPHLVDHKKREATLDNRRENLRMTLAQNPQNQGLSKRNTSGFKGVSICRYVSGDRWQACIAVKKKNRCLGIFSTRELAAQAYDTAAKELHGNFAVTNASLGLLGGLK